MTMRAQKRSLLGVNDAIPLPPIMDKQRDHYPFSVVWTTIPILSWVFPFVGHIGICDSQGRVYDFQGTYSIGDDQMLFGNPVKYWDVSPLFVPTFYARGPAEEPSKDDASAEAVRREIDQYDQALFNVIQHFQRTEKYNFFSNNCHAFVAAVLNAQPLAKRRESTVTVATHMFVNGTSVSFVRAFLALLPFALLCIFVICIASLV